VISVLRFLWPRRTRRHYCFEKKSSRHNKVPGTSATEKRPFLFSSQCLGVSVVKVCFKILYQVLILPSGLSRRAGSRPAVCRRKSPERDSSLRSASLRMTDGGVILYE